MEDDPESEIIHREFDTDVENPATQVVEAVAEVEGTEQTELTPIWSCVDSVLVNLFSNPPSPEAQMEIDFSYEGYRITVGQNGSATFVKTS
ncbi:HalOD1 output domain-containing protein [Natranaeroarchaeum aerophilus]|uniref:Halobacterial output domain-containing protein n=1 Tax=Natranaeroarchaeum aerophilus TaxID=2917711 RepID=A0AAE3FN58_9EURY|nr:HalOD1 output domain-containing protein [Natranaeroarchaeum aerophilus]MCL9812086.1 hypothetical protein [Natranaeroarchaeum aerophilus]